MKAVFVIGSPRSGTTLLENILNCHSHVAEWYEPYYLWEKYFPSKENDIWQAKYLNTRARENIQKEFLIFSKKSKKPIVLDKYPVHSFNLEIINTIFPDARWIHILRDGRDVTLSMKKEWHKRALIVERRDFRGLLRVTADMLQRQHYWRYRFMALLYELRANKSLNPARYLNKSKWEGKVGWGPRFQGWKEYLQTHSPLEFNAMQWVKCVKAVRKNWDILPENNKIEIRYEELLRFPEKHLMNVLEIMGIEPSDDFFKKIPRLKRDNFHKWPKEFTAEEILQIKPILSPLLHDLGYAHPDEW